MKPMISPWTIYFASRADAVGTLFLIVAVAAFAICLIGFDDLTKNGFKLFISIGIISVILTVLTPTTERLNGGNKKTKISKITDYLCCVQTL